MPSSILLIQLCDTHIADSANPVLGRVDQIVAAARAERLEISDCYVVVPGDIAYSGRKSEYDLATEFFNALLSAISVQFPNVTPQIVFSAGNHDCDLTTASDIRAAGLKKEQIPGLKIEGGFVREFLAVQNAFRDFVAGFGQFAKDESTRLHGRVTFTTSSDRVVAFTCINSAWMSTNPEGNALLFPNQLHTRPEGRNADPEVTLIHHPIGWFEPDNGTCLRESIERGADIVLLGHEHRHESFNKSNSQLNLEYVAGQAMYDPRTPNNGFNLVLVDPAAHEYSVATFVWRDSKFVFLARESRTFLRNKALSAQGFTNNNGFLDSLTNIGTGFTHAHKHLRLSDVYVFPNLFHREYQRNLDDRNVSPRRVKFRSVPEFVLAEPKLFVLGADRSGKTAFAKTIYRLMQTEKEVIPVLLDGAELADPNKVHSVIDQAYISQYSVSSAEAFRQLPPDRVCLIIDDLHKSMLSTSGRIAVLQKMEQRANRIVMLASDTFDIDKVLKGTFKPVYWDFRQYVIEDLNRVQRGLLIEKWVTLGRTAWESEDTLNREIKTKEEAINTLLGKQLLPSHPIIVLAFLQTLESMRNPSTINGSYGELYESLITKKLASVSRQGTDVGILYTIISWLAYFLYLNESEILTTEDVEGILDSYFAESDIRRSADVIIPQLISAEIIVGNGSSFRFVYKYYFHYFAARYFRDRVDDGADGPALRAQLRFMADRVYFEDYSNIIIFYLYLVKDVEVIKQILVNAKDIYKSFEPSSLEGQEVQRMNRLSTNAIQPITLAVDDIECNREALRQAMDEVEEQAKHSDSGKKLVYAEDLDDVIKLNIGFKTTAVQNTVGSR
jgi:hypothetical protein